MAFSKVLAGVLLTLFLSISPITKADEVDDILGFLADAGIVDPAIKDATELIRCLAKSSPSQCVDVQGMAKDLQSDAVSEAEKQAAKFKPDDPMIESVVNIVKAAHQQDWIRVLELTGVKLLGQIACKTSLKVTGPLEPVICGEFGELVLDKTEPVVHEVLVIVKDFPNIDIWRLISTVGFDLACGIAKDTGIPLVGEACGLLGKAVKAIIDVGKAILGAVGKGLTAVNKAISSLYGSGGTLLSSDEYYANAIRPLMYRRALERLINNRQDLGLDAEDVAACVSYSGMVYGSDCTVKFPKRLRQEAEALVKLVQSMPQAYADSHLGSVVRDRAIAQVVPAQTLFNYINKLPPKQWSYLMEQGGVKLMAANTGLSDVDISFYNQHFRDCDFWVNEQLMGNKQTGVPQFNIPDPLSLATWICYQGAGKAFLKKQMVEEKYFAKIKAGLNDMGCPAIPGKGFSFNCQTHFSYSICVNQSYKDFGANRYCRADRDKTASSLADFLIHALGNERCQYTALSKGKYGDFDPQVRCSRPWKQQTCEALLKNYRAKFEAPSSRIRMTCSYYPDAAFKQEQERAKQILLKLNGGLSNPGVRGRQTSKNFDVSNQCKTLWDPLAINCPHQTKLPDLPAALASPAIQPCNEDKAKNGSSTVCYQTVFTAQDSQQEIAATTPLTEAPPNPCQMEVPIYTPQTPIIRALSSVVQAGDQIEIECRFAPEVHTIEWARCDMAANKAMELVKSAYRSNSRYSGITSINDNTVGVSSSPINKSEFSRKSFWVFKEPGEHKVQCLIDNSVRFASPTASNYLDKGASISVAPRETGRRYQNFQSGTPQQVKTKEIESSPLPTFTDPNIKLITKETKPKRLKRSKGI